MPDRVAEYEAASAAAREARQAHARDAAEAAEARREVEKLDAEIATLEAEQRRADAAARRRKEAAERREAERRRDEAQWDEKSKARQTALAHLPGGVELYLAHLADLDPKWNVNGNSSTTRANIDAALGAAESDTRRLERLRGVLSDEAAAARYREEFDRTGRFTTADIDRAIAAAERDRTERRRAATERRVSRLERLLSAPGGGEAFTAALDGQAPSWRRTGTRPSDIDRALDVVERGRDPDQPPAWRHRLVLEAERTFPGAASTAWRDAGAGFDRSTETGRRAGSVSRTLSDRAHARALAAERPEPPAPRNLVRRLFDWLRTRVEKLLRPSRRPAAAVAEIPVAAGSRGLTALQERYREQWPEQAADIRLPHFGKLAVGGRNKLFERQESHSSWTDATPGELPAALAGAAPGWDQEAVERVTRLATPGLVYRKQTPARQAVAAHLGDYEYELPEQYAHGRQWRAIRERAEEAIGKLQTTWRYKRADRRGDDRKKRELEAAAINRACGRDARRLHEEMTAAREAARPDWEITTRIRAVQERFETEQQDRLFKLQQERERTREREHPLDRSPVRPRIR